MSRGGAYAYDYDNIGNRKTAQEGTDAPATTYTSNQLNQYTAIAEGTEPPFVPTYDADGNQTKLQTSTGEWNVVYNALNQATSFTQGNKRVECRYDYLNRRVEKAVYEGETLMSKKRFIYNGYLQIAELDARNTSETVAPVLRQTYLWDPLEPIATQVLAMSVFDETGTYEEDLYFTHGALKNTTALFGIQAGRRALYEYGPYGSTVKMEGNAAEVNPFRFSSEYFDEETGLVQYNFRYYNPTDGRWIRYTYIKNKATIFLDFRGLVTIFGKTGVLSNCFGYAVTGKTNVFAYPVPTRPGEPQTSLIDEFNNSQSGWKCKVVKNYSQCICSKKCSEKMLVSLYKNTNKTNGKNPFEDPNFPWDMTSQTSDIHAIRSTNPSSSQYTEIPCTGSIERTPNQVSQDTLDKLFGGDAPLMCCCKNKKS